MHSDCTAGYDTYDYSSIMPSWTYPTGWASTSTTTSTTSTTSTTGTVTSKTTTTPVGATAMTWTSTSLTTTITSTSVNTNNSTDLTTDATNCMHIQIVMLVVLPQFFSVLQ